MVDERPWTLFVFGIIVRGSPHCKNPTHCEHADFDPAQNLGLCFVESSCATTAPQR